MAPPVPEEMRWLIVEARLLKKMRVAKIAKQFKIHVRTYKRIMSLFNRTGDVVLESNPRHRGPLPQLTEEQKEQLVELLVSEPSNMLKEHHEDFLRILGDDAMHISTFCRAVKALGFSRKKLRAFAQKRDAERALQFKAHIIAHFELEQLFFLDETSKNRDSLRRRFGYALRGMSPIDMRGYVPRSRACSSLCGFDVKGFVNWYTIRKTFDKKTFMEACEATVVCASTIRTHRITHARTRSRTCALDAAKP